MHLSKMVDGVLRVCAGEAFRLSSQGKPPSSLPVRLNNGYNSRKFPVRSNDGIEEQMLSLPMIIRLFFYVSTHSLLGGVSKFLPSKRLQ